MIPKITNSIVRATKTVNTPTMRSKAGNNEESIKFRRRVKQKKTTIAVVQLLNNSSLNSDSL